MNAPDTGGKFVPTHRFKGRLCRVLEEKVPHVWAPNWSYEIGGLGTRIEWRGTTGKLTTAWVSPWRVKELKQCQYCTGPGKILVTRGDTILDKRCPRCKGLGKV